MTATTAIGICTALELARWGPWEEVVHLLPRSYSAAVQRAGANALLLPPDPQADHAPTDLFERVDGLLLAGGADIDPAFYGQEHEDGTGPVWPERDRFEIALASAALERGIPVLGICRGMQLLNVARGGSLVQDLPSVVGHDEHRRTPGAFADHQVKLEPGSLAAQSVGSERTAVKSHHHQGIDQLGEGLVESGWSVPDQAVEAIELPRDQHPFALGVLWHPEEDEVSRVVGSLVQACRPERHTPGREAEEVSRID